ncbi:uncharacterized protein LOC143198275 [Rhynchophorus ferrugineus]|uniref:uncharacterized protein LOC143198275 n=1 Tax=Rhynchophorus ferrugineus TaxID=354439 RepID=UPI003FCD717E
MDPPPMDILGSIPHLVCPVCKKSFAKSSQLNYHLKNLNVKLVRICGLCRELQSSGVNSTSDHTCGHDVAVISCSFCKAHLEPDFVEFHLCFHTKKRVNQNGKKYNKRNWPPPPYICSFCGKEYGRYGYMLLINHEKRHQKNNQLQCKRCNIVFDNERERATHIYKVHKKVTVSVCDVCGLATRHIARHKTVHRLERTFKCEQCPKVFRASYGLKKHKQIHSDEAKYKCNVCEKLFTYKYNMKVHMRTHADVKPFDCYICKKTFTTKQWRDKHSPSRKLNLTHCNKILVLRNEDVPITTLFQPLKCYICSKTFRNKEQITHHYDNLIVKIVYKCRICNDALSETKYCDHDDEFTGPHCEFCGILIDAPIKFHICFHLNFPQKSDYDGVSRRRNKRRSEVRSPPDDWSEDEYMSKQEYSDWAYDSDTEMCIYCDKVLPAKSLGKHEEWHRNHDYRVKNLKVSQKTKRPSPNDESLCSFCGLFKPNNKIKRHEYVDHTKTKMRKVCDICGIFTCPTYIKEHMRTHDAVQGFKCEECGKAFFRRKALARHRLVHSDVAKWICSDCGKSFKIKFNLRVHMRTHEDVKPFSCSVCKKTFTTKQWRDNHMKTHGIMGQ